MDNYIRKKKKKSYEFTMSKYSPFKRLFEELPMNSATVQKMYQTDCTNAYKRENSLKTYFYGSKYETFKY